MTAREKRAQRPKAVEGYAVVCGTGEYVRISLVSVRATEESARMAWTHHHQLDEVTQREVVRVRIVPVPPRRARGQRVLVKKGPGFA